MGYVRWRSSNHQMASSHHLHQAGWPVECNPVPDMYFQDRMRLALHQMRHCRGLAGLVETTGPILRDHSLLNLQLMHCHGRVARSLRTHQLLGTKHVHKEQQGRWHILDKPHHEDRLFQGMVHRHSYLLHIVGTGSSIERNMGSSSKGDRMDSLRPVVVAGG
jgi:hypothetical protein